MASSANLSELFALADLFPAIADMTIRDLRDHVGGTARSNGIARRGPGRPPKAASAKPVTMMTTSGRLARRTEADLHKALDKILSVVVKHPDGLRAEELQAALGWDKRELPRPIALGLKKRALKKTGQKRATRYFLGHAKTNAAPKIGRKKK